MTTAERKACERLTAQLRAAGVDPQTKAELVHDYAAATSRIAELRRREAGARGRAKNSATRLLNAALSERRKLHQTLFRGSRTSEFEPSTGETAADDAWRALIWGERQGKTVAEIEARWAILKARFGPPSMSALVDEDPVEAARLVSDYGKGRRGQPK